MKAEEVGTRLQTVDGEISSDAAPPAEGQNEEMGWQGKERDGGPSGIRRIPGSRLDFFFVVNFPRLSHHP